MNEVREAYLRTAGAAVDLLGRRELGDRWNDETVLPEFAMGALAGHLARAILTPYWYLDMPEPDPPVLTAAEYFAAAPGDSTASNDPHSEANVGIRARAEDTAKGGWARLYLDAGKALDRVAERLAVESTERRVPAVGKALLIDEYLKTRIIELVYHVDDLARSLELPSPALPPEATTIAIAVLVGSARLRHGDRAVLNALGRRELDATHALRVL